MKSTLSKIFSLVPLICKKPGLNLSELQKIANFSSEEELRKSLEALMMFGVPPLPPLTL